MGSTKKIVESAYDDSCRYYEKCRASLESRRHCAPFPLSLDLITVLRCFSTQATIRMILGLGGLVPLPPDALVTPVTFRVRKRELRGILAEFDELEDGTRELSGEWVVTKRLWQRLQAEWKASQSKSRADPSTPPRKHNERIILYLHGGQSSRSPPCLPVLSDSRIHFEHIRSILFIQSCHTQVSNHSSIKVH